MYVGRLSPSRPLVAIHVMWDYCIPPTTIADLGATRLQKRAVPDL